MASELSPLNFSLLIGFGLCEKLLMLHEQKVIKQKVARCNGNVCIICREALEIEPARGLLVTFGQAKVTLLSANTKVTIFAYFLLPKSNI